VATALAEQRPGTVAGLALIDYGPTLAAKIPERPLFRLVLTQFPGRLLWRRAWLFRGFGACYRAEKQ
jgi:hypothetical protein